MRKLTAVVFPAVLVLACAFPIRAVDRPVYDKIKAEEMEHSQIMHTLHLLTDRYGPRLTGSPNFENAANWVVKQLTEWVFFECTPGTVGFRPSRLAQRACGRIHS